MKILEVKPAKVESLRLLVAPDMSLIRPLADNAAVVAAPPEIVRPPLPVTKALEFNPAIVVIALLAIKMLVLVTATLEVKKAKVETAPLIVAFDAPLTRPLASNASMVSVP